MANRSIERRPTGCADWSPLMSDVRPHQTLRGGLTYCIYVDTVWAC